ncbi:MAG: ribonuclease HII [Pseudobdellovibrionaceae bacterium]
MATKPNFRYEDDHAPTPVIGLDEVGRGPLAGPVVAAAVYIPTAKRKHPVWSSVKDSKQLTPQRRDILFDVIQQQCSYGIGSASVAEIDEINILQATFLAMRRAIANMPPLPHVSPVMLIDGNRTPKDWPWQCVTLIKGDALSVSIAAASILAKVTRDHLMCNLAEQFPAYGWADNAGYGTPSHLDALEKWGATAHHRQSFAPIKNLLLSRAG